MALSGAVLDLPAFYSRLTMPVLAKTTEEFYQVIPSSNATQSMIVNRSRVGTHNWVLYSSVASVPESPTKSLFLKRLIFAGTALGGSPKVS